ncbi:hypothetical protein G4B88_002067, partial [Cannabis sativa]
MKVQIREVTNLNISNWKKKIRRRRRRSRRAAHHQGWLPGLKADGDNQLPTIAIVASYDTFGASPIFFLCSLSMGSDSNGSGAVALLEIARLFSILYSNPNTRG